MNNDAILASIDEQIERLKHARAILQDATVTSQKRGPGRPKKTLPAPTPKKRTMSIEARERIAAAQKKRWAAVRKAAK